MALHFTDKNQSYLDVTCPPIPLVAIKHDSLENQRQTLQNIFDYAKSSKYKEVVVSGGTILVDEVELTYSVSDSKVIFKNATLKLKSNLKSSNILKVIGKNIVVEGFAIDGDRDNNIIDNVNRGTQFGLIVSSSSDNVKLCNGLIKNMSLCGIQITSENTIIDNVNIVNVGEHGIYLQPSTLRPNLEKATVTNCTIKNYGLETSYDGWGIKLRDYQNALIDNVTFSNDVSPITGSGGIDSQGRYNSTNTMITHTIRNCTFANTVGTFCVNADADYVYIDKCKLTKQPVRRNSNNIITDVSNSIFKDCNSDYPNPATHHRNCSFLEGNNQFRHKTDTQYIDCDFIYDAQQNGILIDLNSQTSYVGSGCVFKGNTFKNCNTIYGVVRTRASQTSLFDGNLYINCGTSRVVDCQGNDVVVNGVDLSNSGVTINKPQNCKIIKNNSFDLDTIESTAAPTTTPKRKGVQHVDTTNKKVYISIGVSSVADWVLLN